jgi:glycogen phosphorylase
MQYLSKDNPIAYFCAEYGIEAKFPFYAGGLGILAGDTVKIAAEMDVPFVGVGLLYRGERIVQEINEEGMQIEKDMDFDPVEAGLEHVYIDEQPLFIKVHLTELDVWCRVWKKTFSDNVVLYLLDTDTDQNQLQERSITHGLYIGTEGTTVKQQFILGIGGVKLLNVLGIHPAIYHVNEGRPAFLHWQLVRKYIRDHGMSYLDACELAKSKTVYTNHTLVAAGNNSVSVSFLKRYASYYAQSIGISVDKLLEKGIIDNSDEFSMTTFGLNVSFKASGVSKLHTKLSKDIWPNYEWVNVTNGVHMATWQDREVRETSLEGDELWFIHQKKKQELQEFIKSQTGFSYDPNHMVITWARRLAGYKRLDSLFEDIERLRSIMRNSQRPMQLLVSGKAHIMDKQGKIKLQKVIKHMARELAEHAIFIPNYNIDIAKHLVKGSDLWINIPEYGKEACGTSGMKALANGVIQCSVSDGWAAEMDWNGMGWTLDNNNVASDLYHKLEHEIGPYYFTRDEKGVPRKWLEMMKNSVRTSGKFSARRMLTEYQEKLYI